MERTACREPLSFLVRMFVFACLMLAHGAVSAASGVDWLLSHSHPDGGFSASGDTATRFQSSAEAVRAIIVQGHPDSSSLSSTLQFLQADGSVGTEHLSRKIIALAETGGDPAGLVAELAASQDVEGGFGESVGFNASVVDTAMALEALALAGHSESSTFAAAVAFLADRRVPDGGWGPGPKQPASAYVTAQVLRGLWPLRHRLDVSALITEARSFLFSAQGADGGWNANALETAAALAALYPTLQEKTPLDGARQRLLGWQHSDGSWVQDVFVTALALRALAYAEKPFADFGEITGRLVDGESGNPVAGVELALSGAQEKSAATDAQGRFRFTDLVQGAYHLSLSVPGYFTVEADLHLGLGERKELGDIHMLTATDPETATVMGTITDALTGAPLVGVTISIDGVDTAAATTGATGEFQIVGLNPGELRVVAERDGYQQVEARVTVSGGSTALFSTSMQLLAPADFSLFGTVTDKNSGLPVEEALVSVSGPVTASTRTDAWGHYGLSGLSAGEVTIEVTAPEYATVTATAHPDDGQRIEFSPALSPAGELPEQPALASLMGQVVADGTEEPLQGATVSVVTAEETRTATSDATGHFSLTEVSPGSAELHFDLEGFEPHSGVLSLSAGLITDIGQVTLTPAGIRVPATATVQIVDSSNSAPLSGIDVTVEFEGESAVVQTGMEGRLTFEGYLREEGTLRLAPPGYVAVDYPIYLVSDPANFGTIRLRREGLSNLLPDLEILHVIRSEGMSDPDSLQATGTLTVDVRNRGFGKAHGFGLLAFHDANGDGAYQKGETILGEWHSEEGLESGGQLIGDLTINGLLPFRDAPISVWVDFEDVVVEAYEDNNVDSTQNLCTIESPVGTFEPVLKWQWTGSGVLSSWNQVMSMPVVGPLEDTNGDGSIGQYDAPAVIFHTFRGSQYSSDGVLRAVSGIDGHELWTITESAYRTNSAGTLALADIDGDGVVEIIAPKNGGGIIVFEHDGSFKWSSQHPKEVYRGGAAIADLEGDGTPEIVVGNTVLNADGSLRWQGVGFTGANFYGTGPLSLVTDIDLDGLPEIIAGAAAYSVAGQKIWQNNTVGDGFAAVGNFNEDDYPEIVVVSQGRLFLLDHSGSIIWGPVAIPGGGYGGAPTVADMDGDGMPEIGVAGGSRYVVLEGDGSLLWTAITRDKSSAMTGSSVFDFDGDGNAEVVYADEKYLRVYRGADGLVLFETPNTSGTTFELPVIVDVDNDNHADIVVCSNSYAFGGRTGIRVFRDKNDSWLNTRKIWNQHTYHVTNINDDGTVPHVERHSWLEHNTYRLNRFLDQDALDSADLTASLLRLVDNGLGNLPSVTVRVGNGGGVSADPGVSVTLYDNDPAAGGIAIAQQELPALGAGEYVDLTFPDVQVPASGQFWVWADSGERVAECDESNNAQSIPAQSGTLLGKAGVAADATEYGAQTPVNVSATGTNTGSLPAEFALSLTVEDSHSIAVADLGTFPLGELAGGASASVETSWNTALHLAGSYQVRVRLLGVDTEVIDEAVAPFWIIHDAGASPAAGLRVSTDRAVYHTYDHVLLESLARNLTSNTIIEAPEIALSVSAPDGTTWFQTALALSDLSPGGQRLVLEQAVLDGAPVGEHEVFAVLRDGSGAVFSTASTRFAVENSQGQALSGRIQVTEPTVEQGDTQTCLATLTNGGTSAIEGLSARQLIVAMEPGEPVMEEQGAQMQIDPSGESEWFYAFSTATVPVGFAGCLLQVQSDGQWRTLDYATFEVKEPPIRIDATLTGGSRGRLLVLLDSGETASGHGGDPHGPQGAPSSAGQRTYLKALLSAAGWSYTIVTDADAFTRELRSGGYALYLLHSEQVKLPEPVQKELREAVHRGEGLVVAGDHDKRNHNVDHALGVKIQGTVNRVDGLELSNNQLAPAGQTFFSSPLDVLRIGAQDTEVVGRLLVSGQPAVTRYRYGEGRSVFIGVDLLAEAARRSDSEPLLRELLLGALADVHPPALLPVAGTVHPVRLTLTNQGIATPGQVSLTIPDGIEVVDAPDALAANGQVIWNFDLAEGGEETRTAWLRLPTDPGMLLLNAEIYTGMSPDFVPYDTVTFELVVQAATGLDAAIDHFAMLSAEASDPTLKKVARHLEAAEAAYAALDFEGALNALVGTTDRLLETTQEEPVKLRLDIDRAMKTVGRQAQD